MDRNRCYLHFFKLLCLEKLKRMCCQGPQRYENCHLAELIQEAELLTTRSHADAVKGGRAYS